MNQSSRPPLLSRGSWPEARRVTQVLRSETVGGGLLVAAAVVALVWANSPWAGAYEELRTLKVGPASLHLDLDLQTWAADGLLAIFFFVVGLELKREFVAGDLRDPRRAALPVVAAVGGMVAPAVIFVVVNLDDGDALSGWAIPTATDIAFAIAVLAVIGTYLPAALRTFLLTLAVVDDLLAITIIAIFYTQELHLVWLLVTLVPLAAFGLLVQRRIRSPWLLVPLAVATWAAMHASGVHATIAGVLLGFTVPVLARGSREEEPSGPTDLAGHIEHRVRPLSAGFAVPVFALFAAGVSVEGLGEALTDRVTLGITLGLVGGKVLGILVTCALLSRFTGADLDPDISWWDLLGVSLLAGIGFTVSLLIGDLAYSSGERDSFVKIGVLTGSLVASVLASVVLLSRNSVYKRLEAKETEDLDQDQVPDVYQRDREE